MITLYHNPQCSQSRAALLLVQQTAVEKNLALEVIDYLDAPLSLAQLTALQAQIGGAAHAMVRQNETEYAELNLAQADDAALLQALATHPKLLQRPIMSFKGKSVIGRPTENIATFLRDFV